MDGVVEYTGSWDGRWQGGGGGGRGRGAEGGSTQSVGHHPAAYKQNILLPTFFFEPHKENIVIILKVHVH